MGWFWPSNKPEPAPRITWHVPENRDDLIPIRVTVGSMAFDLVSPETIVIPKHDPILGVGSALINSLVVASIPPGYALVLRSRSGWLPKKQSL